MKKKGFTSRKFLLAILLLLWVMLVIVLLVKEGASWIESEGKQEGKQERPTYQITALWKDKESGRAEFLVKGLIKDPNTGYTSYLSQAKRKIEDDGYDVEVIPASYKWNKVQAIWVIAKRKK